MFKRGCERGISLSTPLHSIHYTAYLIPYYFTSKYQNLKPTVYVSKSLEINVPQNNSLNLFP